MDVVEVLSFLFMLSTMELGRVSNGWYHIVARAHVIHLDIQEYSTENLSQTQQAMLEDLRDYGLVWQREAIISPCLVLAQIFNIIISTAIITEVQSHTSCNDPDLFFPSPPDIDRDRCRFASTGFHHT